METVSPCCHLSWLSRQWLDNLFSFPGDILERNSDLHEFGLKLLLIMKLSWQLLSRPQSRLVLPHCREDCLIVTRNCLQGQGGVNLENKTSVIVPAFFWLNYCTVNCFQLMMMCYSLYPCALQMTLSPLSRFWSVGHLEDLHGPSNSVYYQEELKQIKRSLSKPVKKS